MVDIDQRNTGLYDKFDVRRRDGRDQPGGDRADALYFVLDVRYDKYALEALRFYAAACESEYPALAADLQTLIDHAVRVANEPRVVAWEAYNGDIVVWGTHDPDEAEAAFDRYCQETGAEFEDGRRPDFQHFLPLWVHPAAIDLEDEPTPRSFVSRDPRPGWVPVMRL